MIENITDSYRIFATGSGLFFKLARNNRKGLANILTQKDLVAASVDVTENCNLRCRHCYLYRKGHQKETLKDEEFLESLDQFTKKHPSILHCIWVGGEPMEREERLREAVTHFPVNWIISNGTKPLRGRWPSYTSAFISLDGTRDIHNQIRTPFDINLNSGETVYDLAMKHADEATIPVSFHMVINRLNAHSIPGVIEDIKHTKAKGIVFSFHTPIVDLRRRSGMPARDEEFWLGAEERRSVVELLIRLKKDKQYGRTILLNEAQIKRYLPEKQLESFGENCPVPIKGYSLDAKFQKKDPCVMGGMDCNKCGCVIPVISHQAELPLLMLKLCS